jgi:hypothetical protein
MAFLKVLQNHFDQAKYEALMKDPEIAGRLGSLLDQPGLQYRFSGRDPETGLGLMVTVWDTREEAERVPAETLPEDVVAKLKEAGFPLNPPLVVEIAQEFKR